MTVPTPPEGSRLVLSRSFPAEPETVPEARRAVVELARVAGARVEQLDALRLATSEAVTNVVRHAYASAEGLVHVHACMDGGQLRVRIGDDGDGLGAASRSPGLGMGLALIAAVSDDLTVVERASGGTELRLRFDLRRPRPRQTGPWAGRPAGDSRGLASAA